MGGISDLLKTYPRKRPELGKEYQNIFQAEYRRNRKGLGILGRVVKYFESWMHRRIASKSLGRILELGAGTLNHLGYEVREAPYDIVEPSDYLIEADKLESVQNVYASSSEISDKHVYDRIISIAVLEHMTDLPSELARAAVLLKENGIFQAGIPNEGSFVWGAAWRMTTGVAFRLRTGLDYAEIMRHEHVNTSREIVEIAKYFFSETKVEYFPLPIPWLGLYVYIEARSPRRDVAKNWLSRC